MPTTTTSRADLQGRCQDAYTHHQHWSGITSAIYGVIEENNARLMPSDAQAGFRGREGEGKVRE